MKFLQSIDRKKAKQLIIGVLGIYSTFIISGLIYQNLTKNSYLNIQTGQQENFRSSIGFNVLNRGISWFLAALYKYITLPSNQNINIPLKNSIMCSLTIAVSSITYIQSIYLVSFPFINMAKSFSLLNVILVGVLCSRVKNKKLKLGPQKIIIAVIITLGIVMFRFFDPQAQYEDQKSTQIKGLIFLLISFISDGLLPDFQAQIKQKFNPAPISMLYQINKWSFILLLVISIPFSDAQYTFLYCFNHPSFVIQIVLLSVISFIGQIFIYIMIKQFQQHIVPFVTTTRKIFSVGISLIYFNHQTSLGQIIGLIVVLITSAYQFILSIQKTNQKEQKSENNENNDQTKSNNSHQITQANLNQINNNFNIVNQINNQTVKQQSKLQQETQKNQKKIKNKNDQNNVQIENNVKQISQNKPEKKENFRIIIKIIQKFKRKKNKILVEQKDQVKQ